MLIEVYILNNNPKYPPLGRMKVKSSDKNKKDEYQTTVKTHPVNQKLYEVKGPW